MKHLYLNLKRFDVPRQYGGVNSLAPIERWADYIVTGTQGELKKFDPTQVEFVQFYPEAHILNALKAREAQSPVKIG